jgi:hypothetical protein
MKLFLKIISTELCAGKKNKKKFKAEKKNLSEKKKSPRKYIENIFTLKEICGRNEKVFLFSDPFMLFLTNQISFT